MDDYNELNIETLALLFDFIPYFESSDKAYDLSKEPSLDPFLYHDTASQLLKLYEEDVILSFDWGTWKEEAAAYFNSPELINNVDLLTISRLFTTIIRADRFVSGYYAGKMEDETILRLLRRIKLLVEEME